MKSYSKKSSTNSNGWISFFRAIKTKTFKNKNIDEVVRNI